MNDEIWSLEEQFWTAGADYYRDALGPDCVMAFPAPAGIIAGLQIVQTLENAPRWSSIAMSERHLVQPSPDIVVIAYRAEGRREGASTYEAYCTSTYHRGTAGWRLIQHQQTPI
jgi:hypothetical protein